MIAYMTHSVPGINITALLLVFLRVLPLAILVLLFFNSKRKGRVILGILAAGVFAVLALGVVGSLVRHSTYRSVANARIFAQQRAAEQAQQQRQAEESYSEQVKQHEIALDPYYSKTSKSVVSEPSSEPIEPSHVEKNDLTAAGFEPDIFASKEAAVRAVTRMVAKQYKSKIASPEDWPHGARLSYSPNLGGQGEDRAAQMSALKLCAKQVIKKVLGSDPQFDVVVLPEPTDELSRADSPRRISIYLNVIQEPQAGEGSQHEGVVEVTIAGKLGQFSRQVDYLNKSWSDDFDRWRNTHRNGSWVLGESDDLCPDRAQSIDQAKRNAALRLREPMFLELLKLPGNQSDCISRLEELNRWLDDESFRRMKAGDFETDVFTQEFKRPYGSVWRSAVLVHVTPEKAGAILATFRSQRGAQRETMLRTLASAVGLSVLILAVYGFLSAATRGYYAWSVRLATVVLAVVGVWCIWLFVA